MRALIIEHNEAELPGLIGQRAEQRGIDVAELVVSEGVTYPDPREFDLVIPLGAPESVRDTDVPWIGDELDMLARAVRDDVPVLGICFGAQMLAHVLGGDVRPGPQPEVGWRHVDSLAPDIVDATAWFELHFDIFSVPPGAHEVARNRAGPQGFVAGPHLGVQFHPEVTPEILGLWRARWPSLFDGLGVDADELIVEARRRDDELRAAAFRLFDRWLARLRHPAG